VAPHRRSLYAAIMPPEIRPLRNDAEFAQHHFISNYAFNGDRGEESAARRSTYYDHDWCLGAFDGDQLVAGLVIIPFEQYLNGARIPLGGIASVSCLPERRRGGFVSALLKQSLATMRDAGQPLSALYTPHYSLYRKYGWELANRIIGYTFPPKPIRTRLPQPAGSFRRVGPDEWPQLDALYTQHYAGRNGAFARTEGRWRHHVFSDYAKGQRDAAIWSNADGEPRGYIVYHTFTRHVANLPYPEITLRVDDWIAVDAEAYSAILNYLLGHDLSGRILMLASPDEPLPDAFEEPTYITEPPGAWFGAMLRLVDIPAAVSARPALPQGSGKSATIALTDATAPWNAGTWHIACGDGHATAERTNGTPQLEMDVRALAPIYNGYTKPADAARVGSIRVHDPRALDALADIFAASFTPYCPDDF
jgi:predicted acetyltransferase